MAGRLWAGSQRLTQPALLRQLDRLLENVVRLGADDWITLDEKECLVASAFLNALGASHANHVARLAGLKTSMVNRFHTPSEP